MIFRQLFEPDTATYTYLLGCPDTRQAVLVDPTRAMVERDLKTIESLNLTLAATVETHLHADHITGAKTLKEKTGSKMAFPALSKPQCADIELKEGDLFAIGSIRLHPFHAPGHTDHHMIFLTSFGDIDALFTGDCLLIDGCGRTDFQSGDSESLYKSIHEKIFTLPDDTLIYPGHDYNHRHVSTVAQEKERNTRVGGGKSLEEFKEIMDNLNLPYPRHIDYAVPGNEQCGICPPEALKTLNVPIDCHDQG